MENIIFGPVPSRRLGRSIGVNNIPPKICSYSCVYCQIGKAVRMQSFRNAFYDPRIFYNQLKERISELSTNEMPDYITIVPDGEPTLDVNLGELIQLIGQLNVPIAVITNSSLMHLADVRRDLQMADYVSVKIDAINANTWKKINKPHTSLDFKAIFNGITEFAEEFGGFLATETMLISGINDSEKELSGIASFIQNINPDISYIAVPTRPPAFSDALPPDENKVMQAFNIFKAADNNVELLIGYEGNQFSASGDFVTDILSITAVHPMRADAVEELMKRDKVKEEILTQLINQRKILKLEYNKHFYYLRNLKKTNEIL